jgi:hypothetical protein
VAHSPTETQYFESFDGTRIAWREVGEGRPVVLIHGYFSDANTNWIRYGHAAKIAAKGFRVIMISAAIRWARGRRRECWRRARPPGA